MNISMVDVINGRQRTGMSDEDYVWEITAQQRLERAIQEMRRALSEAANNSSVMSIDRTGFEDYLHDASLLDFKHWNEMISKARNP